MIETTQGINRSPKKSFSTVWGYIAPDVDIFPIIYILFIYGFIYILPFGRDIIGISWFDWCRSEDGPLEWIQFITFILASIYAFKIIYFKKANLLSAETIGWLALAIICLFIAGEEISWGERIINIGLDSLREINKQGESNIHNIRFIHNYLLDPAFEISCLIFGWIGWRFLPNFTVLPKKRYSLYFLFVALFFMYFDISYASTVSQIRNDQEIFETLMSIGLFLHCKNNYLKYNI
tara:strand:+ start:157 stop:864 length:708 start_codon:yes stop_codon:yes gene_type:complete